MPDVRLDTPITLDLLQTNAPAPNATSDMPVMEIKPDSTPATDEVRTTAESETAETPVETTASDAPPKVAKGVQKRLDELVRQREEANRRAESEREERMKLLEIISRQNQPQPQVPQDDEPKKPDRNAYADPNDYDAALDGYVNQRAAWIARREVRQTIDQERQKQQQEAIALQQSRVRDAFKARRDKTAQKYADYSAVAENPNVTVTQPMAVAIMHSDQGPEVAYYLGSNPSEAARISTLSPPLQLIELGKIEARLTQPASPTPQVSKAPAPIKPATPGTEASVTPENETMEQYGARRNKEIAAERSSRMRH